MRLRARWAYYGALAVAELLSAHRARIARRIKFVFQPAEEIGLGAP
jgi:metal-dependent amidase/aminoacylase/carboxypeptidase family protein